MQRKINVVQTKEGNYTLSINNVFLHSSYYPTKEAENFIKNNIEKIKDKELVVVYGIGLAYHLTALMNIIGENCRVIAFDSDIEVINKSEELGMLDKLKKYKRLELIFGDNEKFLIELSNKMNLVDDIIVYSPSVKVLPDQLEPLKAILNSYNLAKISIDRFGKVSTENYNANLKEDFRSIKVFFNERKFTDKPVVIAAGGPSLELELKDLIKYRDKLYIFALGRTLDILMKNEIKPDIITIIDPQDIVFEQIKAYLNLDIPLFFLSTANNKAVKNYQGLKYIFFNDLDVNNVDNIIIKTGKSVAVAALDIAVKAGAKLIIFAGQDLAFLDNKFHAGDEFTEKTSHVPKGNRRVAGVDGKMLDTNLGLLEFKRNIENIIVDNPQITFVNCSKGARISGTIEKKLKDIF